ncbi:MAG: protein-L-isoaspartate O-methyltransferase [Omnitrophica bacterium RIFCSPLOWO2_01_FULL_45_10b]|nr:MAG: protein-L-isoaspartate O-methyltransferase [Omnitrophica bacterium RIFCSPLOWO2_01_FULL_45_10b]
MIERQLKGRGIKCLEVLTAFRKIPREQFIPPDLKMKAYEDHPLSIGYNQTISQPYIVALMTERLEITKKDRVLEIGTGSGYQTAILAELAGEVYSVEIVEPLHGLANERLQRMGYKNVHLKHGDGCSGWPEEAPFDKMIATAAAKEIPQALMEQLKEGGRIVIPVGELDQDLVLGIKRKNTLEIKHLTPVRFVIMQSNVS